MYYQPILGQRWVWQKDLRRLQVTETKFLRGIENLTGRDRIRNENIQDRLKVESLEERIKRKLLQRFGNKIRMEEIRMSRRALENRKEKNIYGRVINKIKVSNLGRYAI